MGRIAVLFGKARRAWTSGTLWERVRRFLATNARRPVEVIAGYARLSPADRALDVDGGFADHRRGPGHRASPRMYLDRIIAAYQASKAAQDDAPAPFAIRGLWKEWVELHHARPVAAMRARDTDALAALLENLFREQFTIGTGGYDEYVRYHTVLGRMYIRYVWAKYRDALRSVGVDPATIGAPAVGNPTGILISGKVVSIETLRHAYHAAQIGQALHDAAAPVVVEIGGGLGGQALQTVRFTPNLGKYANFDIPEVAALSSYVLLSAFPEKRLRLFGEGPVSVASTEAYDIAIFPHFTIPQLGDRSVDLFFNSCSFSEMDGRTSSAYLEVIERAGRRYFMHDNHDVEFRFKNADGSMSVNVIGSELVPDQRSFRRVFKRPRVHGLPEDRGFVHHEFLYERLT